MKPAPVVLILAAGRAERFYASGGDVHKLDATLAGKPVLSWVLEAVRASGLVGHLVRPEGGTQGMGESIALGVRATHKANGWLILPGDLPFVAPATLAEVAKAMQEDSIVLPHYQQQPGHPVGFGRAYYARMAALMGDSGAKHLVAAARTEGLVRDLNLNDPGIVQDIDTLDDLAQAQRRIKRS